MTSHQSIVRISSAKEEGFLSNHFAQQPASGRSRAQSVAEFPLEQFIHMLDINSFARADDEEKKERLASIDVLELFTALQKIYKEIATTRLENHFLTDFLEKNDPKLLIGLKQRRATASIRRTNTSLTSHSRTSINVTRRLSSSTRSVMTTQSSVHGALTGKKTATDYRLNNRAKAEMAEKTAADVEKRIRELETQGMREIKRLNCSINELKYRCEETEGTLQIFNLHFTQNERDLRFLETATERQIDKKFRKFVTSWTKNAKALLATMRLQSTSLQEKCQERRGDLITKADLSGVLEPVDYDQLVIKKTQLLNSLEDKNNHMAGLKGVTGKASMAMSEEKQLMMAIEDESKRISQRIIDVVKHIAKLEKETKMCELDNIKDQQHLDLLKRELLQFKAPSVVSYIEKKNEVTLLEKERNMLQRKLNILAMKLTNIQKKCLKRSLDF